MTRPFHALVSDPIAPEGVEVLERSGIFSRVDVKTGLSPGELNGILADYDALLVRSMTQVRAETLAHAPRLAVIGRAGAGVDNIDVPAATANGTLVMNTPGGNNNAVAELVLAMMFAIARKLPEANASTKAGKWEKSRFLGVELQGRTLGIIGLGAIGQVVALKAQALGMDVLAHDPQVSEDTAIRLGARLVTLQTLLERADVVTVHVPLSPAVRGLMDASAFAAMKRGAWFVDAARGGIADEAALLGALDSGQVGFAALDVYAQEPPAADNPLLRHPHVICTPHIGASTREAQDKVGIQIAHQVVDYLRSGTVVHAVNTVRPR